MEEFIVGASLTIPESLLRVLEEEAGRRGVTPEAVLADVLLELVPEEDKVNILLDTARTCLDNAARLQKEDKYGEAYKRIWSAITLVLKAHALREGIGKTLGLEDMWGLVEKLSEEVGEHAYTAFYAALAADIAALKNLAFAGHFNIMAKTVRDLIEKLGGSKG